MTTDAGPVLTLGQAVKATGTARSTLQRRLAADAIPGAHRTDNGTWAIPVSGLIAAGLAPRTTPADEPADTLEAADDDAVNALRAENERLRADLGHARELAEERARTVDTLTQALDLMARALPPGEPVPVTTRLPADEPEPVPRRWMPRRWRKDP